MEEKNLTLLSNRGDPAAVSESLGLSLSPTNIVTQGLSPAPGPSPSPKLFPVASGQSGTAPANFKTFSSSGIKRIAIDTSEGKRAGVQTAMAALGPAHADTATGRILSASPLEGTNAKLILRKSASISFYLDLISPVAEGSSGHSPSGPRSPIKSHVQRRLSNSRTRAKNRFILRQIKYSHRSMRNKSPEEMLSKLNQRQNRALQRRNLLLDERSERLKQRREDSTYQLLIHEKRQLLRNVKLRARLEYGLSSASIKRQTLLRRKAERFSVRVMHAQTVCMMQKLKKYVDLRRTFSQELDELLRQSMDADADRDDFDFDTKLYLTKSKSRFKSKSRRPKPPRAKSPAVGNTGVLVKDSPASSPEKLSPGKVSPSKISPSTASFLKSLSSSSGSPSSPESDLSSDDESLTDRIRRVRLLPPELYQSMEESEYMLLLDLLPPITRFTLRELDLDEILTNRQLRHDIIFDPDLQFKPNMDGERGEQKRAKADRYWSEVDIELGEGSTYRIPLLLHEVLAILLELLPPSQDLKRDIEDHLDVNLLAQELDHGVFNAAGLIKYLAELLKKNCAPARDELVDSMEAEALAGQTIKALRICFDVLEYMKLDYANHQLHRLRPHIVEHAVEYEWKQFRERFDLGSVKVDETVSWIHGAVLRFRNKTTKSIFADKIDLGDDNTKLPPFNVLYNEAFLSLVLQAHVIDTILPETLSMDQSRIVQYYNDWQDITILGSLVILFRQVCGPKCSPGAIKEVKQKLWVLLNDNETSIAHVCLQMSDDAAKIRGTALSEKEKTTLSGIVESTLSPSSALYDMMQKRIGGYFEYYLANGDLDRDLIRRHGLGELVPEIETLSTKMSKLIVHNKAVYSTVYSTIMEAGI